MRADAAGNYYYVDRLRHMIRRRGVNIASREIEDILAAHQSIAECAAIAVPAPLGEDDIKVVVRPAVDALSENDVAEIAAALLPKHMCPRYIELVAELPLTITQRVKQFELKQEWQTAATWDVEMRKLSIPGIAHMSTLSTEQCQLRDAIEKFVDTELIPNESQPLSPSS